MYLLKKKYYIITFFLIRAKINNILNILNIYLINIKNSL